MDSNGFKLVQLVHREAGAAADSTNRVTIQRMAVESVFTRVIFVQAIES